MSIYKKAKELAKKGFYIFPLKENSKLPKFKEFTNIATNDPDDLKKFWVDPLMGFEHQDNIGIATSKFKDGQALLVVDVDNSKGKDGSKSLTLLKKKGFDFPKTLTQKTPSGGFHMIYKVDEPVKQGVDILKDELDQDKTGIDIRSRGGYILGAGSLIDGTPYLSNNIKIAKAPDWLIKKCNEGVTKERQAKNAEIVVDQKGAKIRAKDYLLNNAPIAVQGAGGDQTTFRVANKLKDFGLTQDNALLLMIDNWNNNCQPPWNAEDLQLKIENAYCYGQNKIGVDSPQADFTPIIEESDMLGPLEELNKEFAFIVLGGKSTILRQTKDSEIAYMNTQAFHDLLKPRTIQAGNGRKKQLSEVWFSSPDRPTYFSAELHPEKVAPEGVYNLWRGFSCKPLADDEEPTKDMIEGVRLFKEHALNNVCLGDENLYNWLIGYFAHLIQKPDKKPLTALVFKGEKGIGKNALIDRVGGLVSSHYMVTSKKKHLLHHFNKHLANLVLFVLDEAFWSGDKQAEGILKDMVTGNTHLIEHKGKEIFSVKNVTRICIISNEDWVVPTSSDERRFAIFSVGSGRQGDNEYFKKMRLLIDKKGGNRLLLKELLEFDLSSVDINRAPDTPGLLEQKIASLNPIQSWWYSCLGEGTLLGCPGGDFGDVWPETIGRSLLRDSFMAYARQRGIKSWLPDSGIFGKHMAKCMPQLRSKRMRDGDTRKYVYVLPSLSESREHFEKYIRHKIDWEDFDEETEQIDNVIDAQSLFS